MNRFLFMIAAGAAALILTAGCNTQPYLPTGKYQISDPGRSDFAVVFEDLIFLRVKSPEDAPGSLAYWEWAGKYKVDDNGEIMLQMDHETNRRWRFYFQFLKKRDGISFNDWAKQTGYMLNYQRPELRSGTNAPRPMGTGGVNPVYQDVSNNY